MTETCRACGDPVYFDAEYDRTGHYVRTTATCACEVSAADAAELEELRREAASGGEP